MPRTGWLALGAVACGLAFGTALPTSTPLMLALLVGAALAGTALASTHRIGSAAVAMGIATLLVRLLVGGLAAAPVVPSPTTTLDGDWVAEVLTLGSTDGGRQRSLLMVRASGAVAAVPDEGGAVAAVPDAGGTVAAVPDAAGPWRTYAWLPRYPMLVPGDRISFHDPLEPVRADGSEFAGYLDSVDAVATTRIREMTVVGDRGALGVAESVRRLADESLARVVPEPMAGLASAILVGRRDRVAREVTESFTATGLSHVVAISGWNIALIGAVIGALLGAAGFGRRQRTIVIVAALGAFTLVAGGGGSVVRAALMGGVALVARELGRPGTAAAALGLAVWLLLLLDPAMATDIGFQLSAAATAGLLAWGGRLTERLLGSRPGPVRRWLGESLGVSLAAQAATLPLVLVHFGRLSLVSPLANLVMAPVVAPAMLVASLCLVAGLVVGLGAPALLGAPFAFLGWAVLGAMVAVAGVFSGLPYASVELPPVPAAVAAIAVVGVVGAVARWGRSGCVPAVIPGPAARAPDTPRPTRQLAVVAALVGAVVLVVGAGALVRLADREARLVVTALDVGQGDAILIQGPEGARVLVDTGPDPDRLLRALDRHVPPWDRRLDLVVVTHPHEDHVAGLAMLLTRYRVGAVAGNGMVGVSPGDRALRGQLARLGMTERRLAAGDRLAIDGAHASVRWPIAGEVPAAAPSDGREVNHTSVVLDLRFGERRMLLTGDIEDDVDPRLLADGIGDDSQRLDVLKVAHHGSRTATSGAWLDTLRPRVALVSVGADNPYGHPSPETIERLEAHSAQVLRTDLDGDLEVSTDGRDLRVATGRGRTTGERPLGPQAPIRGDLPTPCYDRAHDDPLAAGGSRPVALDPPGGRDPGALAGHRGRGVVPRGRPDPRGPPARPRCGGGRRAAA